MEYIRQILANNLQDLRKSNGLKQVELANLLGVTAASYNRWENGLNWPDPESLEKIASYYNIPSSQLFFDPSLGNKPLETWTQKTSPKVVAQKLQEVIDLLKN